MTLTYTIIEVAEMLKVSKKTILEVISKGELKAFRIGNTYRITQEALDVFVANNTLNKGNLK